MLTTIEASGELFYTPAGTAFTDRDLGHRSTVHQGIDRIHAIGGQPGNKDGLSASIEFLVKAISPHPSAARGSSTLPRVAYIELVCPWKRHQGASL